MSASMAQPIDQTKLHDFVMKAVGEMGAAMNAALIIVGDKLGLYKAMSGAGPLTSAELAAKTRTTERYVREWLSAQAAGGFVTYDAATGKFTLPPWPISVVDVLVDVEGEVPDGVDDDMPW